MPGEELASRRCKPCDAGTPPLQGEEARRLLEWIGVQWDLVDDHHLTARFKFDDFADALAFTNRVGAVADREGHHPEVCLTWGRATVRIWTHAIDGLSDNDFILAAKIDQLYEG